LPARITTPGPALICCHGYGGAPEQVAGIAGKSEPNHYLRDFGVSAVKQGYVVFAPLQMNDQPSRTWLDRKAIVIGQRLFGLEINKIMRTVDYLQTLPQVSKDRIGIYGISNGGRTALFSAALDQRLKVSAVSGMFNNTTPKLTKPSKNYLSFIETPEDHIYFYDQCNEFSDSDIASLICPRSLFVEAGLQDHVFDVELLKQEFALVTETYGSLGIPERAELGFFDGPHVIYGKQSFPFIRRWLFAA
jgi:dienelactone hydrolase